MKNKVDVFNTFALIVCAASVTFAAASHGSFISRLICAASALLAVFGIVWKLRERKQTDG